MCCQFHLDIYINKKKPYFFIKYDIYYFIIDLIVLLSKVSLETCENKLIHLCHILTHPQ